MKIQGREFVFMTGAAAAGVAAILSTALGSSFKDNKKWSRWDYKETFPFKRYCWKFLFARKW